MNEKSFSDESDATVFGFDEGSWVLRGVSGEHFGKTYDIDHALVIGRSPECDLVLNSSKVSRRHARINRTALALTVEDLDSSNGTFVNNDPVSVRKLQNGDQIQFGFTERFMVVLEREDRAVETPPVKATPAETVEEESASGSLWLVAVLVLAAAGVAGWWFLA